jgi:hypothetical protein
MSTIPVTDEKALAAQEMISLCDKVKNILVAQGITRNSENKVKYLKDWILSVVVKQPKIVTFQVAQAMKSVDFQLKIRGQPSQLHDFYVRKYGNIFDQIREVGWKITYLLDDLELDGSRNAQNQIQGIQDDLNELMAAGYVVPLEISHCLRSIDRILATENVDHQFEQFWVTRQEA